MTRKFIISVGLAVLMVFNVSSASEVQGSKNVIATTRSVAKHESDVRKVGSVTVEELNEHFAKYNGALKGKGHVFIEMEQKYGVSARFMAAIATQESGCGSAPRTKRTNDCFGMTGCGSKKWDSIEQNIESAFSLIDRRYIKRGKTSVASIGKVYCVNKTWASKVSGHMKRI